MKQLRLLGISLLAISACAPQSPPPPAMTAAFDGTYGSPAVTGKSPPTCPDLGWLPNWTITNGRAVAQGPNLGFTGSVTPTGALAMNSITGQTFAGQIDPHFVLTGRVTGPNSNCAYYMTWTRMS